LSLEAVLVPALVLLWQEDPELSSTAEWKPLDRLDADEFGRSTALPTFGDVNVGIVCAVVVAVGNVIVIGDA